MATLSITEKAFWTGTTSGSSNSMIGYETGASRGRSGRFAFTTDGNGATSFSFSISGVTRYTSSNADASSPKLAFALSTSADAYINYVGSGDGTVAMSYNGANYTATGSVAKELLPNTTYYLWIFPNSASAYSLWVWANMEVSNVLTTSGSYAEYTLTTSCASTAILTVSRTASVHGSTGALSNGATIYPGDVLVIDFSGTTGYNASGTLNGTQIASGYQHTVSTNVSVVITATVKGYTLAITADANATVTVTRTASPLKGAATGALSNGATIYYNDVLTITASAKSGYEIKTATLNDGEIVSPHTVTDDVSITVISSPLGFVYIDINTQIEPFSIVIDTGSKFELYRAYIDNGTSIGPY